MNKGELEALIAKYDNGDTSLEEERLLSDHFNKGSAQEIRNAGHAQFAYFKSRQNDQPGDAFMSRIEAIASGQAGPKQRSLRWVVRIAAAMATIAVIAWLLLLPDTDSHEFATRAGERRSINLPDGTVAWLNAGTRIAYDNTFGTGVRELTLSGEAYFEVQHNPAKAFRIHMGKVTVEVLGTSFNLRSYPDEPEIILDVTAGKVNFGRDKKIEVTSGNEAKYNISTGRMEPLKPSNPNATAWKTRRLVFEDALLGDVVSDLGKYFDKSIILETPETLTCHFTGDFKDPALEQVLKVIGYSLNIKHSIKNDTIILRGQNCSTK